MCDIALFNDTGSYPHVGCKAVSDAHNNAFNDLGINVKFRYYVEDHLSVWKGNLTDSIESLFNSALAEEIRNVDAVIVNGEGTIHNMRGLHLLVILACAQQLNKPTFLINAVLQNIPQSFFSILHALTDLTVRDLNSYQYMLDCKIKCRLVPDSILSASFDARVDSSFQNKVVVTDVVAGQQKTKEIIRYALNYYQKEAIYFPLEGDNSIYWQDTVSKFKMAKLIVSGRHHGIYLALLARVPFVALQSNSWKIEGLMSALDAPEWMVNSIHEFDAIAQRALANVKGFDRIFESNFLKNHNKQFDKFIEAFCSKK